jgi:Ca2+-binding RTX toxin-like protein
MHPSTFRHVHHRYSRSAAVLLAAAALVTFASRVEAAVTANVVATTLVVNGDGLDNQLTVRVVAGDATRIEVLDAAAVVGSFLRSTFTSISVDGAGGNDTILVSRANGNFTETANLFGGPGIDTITSGNTNDSLFGGDDNDTLIWNPGEGSDIIEGGNGTDTLQFNGSNGNEVFAETANGVRVNFTRDVGSITMDIGTTENLVLNMLGGDDSLSATGNLAALIVTTVNGGDGNDNILGSNGLDTLSGGAGNDFIDGQQGNDQQTGGDGDDTIQWDPGDGSDLVEGGPGVDKLVFNGSNGAEIMSVVPNDVRIRLTRNLGNIVMDIGTTEDIEINALGGIDSVTGSNGLVTRGLLRMRIDGGADADALTGGDTDDTILGGLDIDTMNGGDGNDSLTGGDGNDTMNGGIGDDVMIWNPGDDNDILNGEGGNDTMLFNGANVSETITITAAAPRVTFFRDIANVTMDVGTTETLQFNGLGGIDTINVGPNLAALTTVSLDLGVGNDVLNTGPTSRVIADGGADVDTLNFNALNQPIQTTANTISVGGVLLVNHVNFETVANQNTLGGIPTLTINSPTTDPAATSTTPFISLAGTAADDVAVTSVTWVNDRGGSGTAIGTTSWSVANVPLQAGVNVITVSANDAQGNAGGDTLTVTVNVLTYTMAEGATGTFFDTDILLANPNSVPAPVQITYLKGDGTTVAQDLTLAATSRTTIEVDSRAGLENAEVSATVTSTSGVPLIVERTMRWDDTNYGAHTEKATDGPALNWYFAEGAQGFFQTYVLLANPGATPNSAEVRFLREGEPPVVQTFPLEPTSRKTIFAGDIAGVVDRSFGIQVTFQNPGVAERAMYFGFTPLFNAGHESAGVNSPAQEWFLAEGATGSFFTTFVLLANPGVSDANATVTFLPDTGQPVMRTLTVRAGERVTLNIATEDASLANTAVATQVTSTQPILVERAQYWPGAPASWYEAHNSFGATSLSTKWGLAEGRVGGPDAYQTYILLANSNNAPSQVRITYLKTDGSTIVKTHTVNATSRFNVHVNSLVPELANESFGAVIEVTSGPGIFVERALYSDRSGVPFAAGTNALATRLP